VADKFILEYAKLVAQKPEEIDVIRTDIDEGFSEIIVYANELDAGKLIGKGGKMIGALKTIISGCKAKENRSFRVVIKTHE